MSDHDAGASGAIPNVDPRPGPKGQVTSASVHARSMRAVPKIVDMPVHEWEPPPTFDEYKLVRLLGKGSMGRVYLAHDTVLDRPVAVKFVGHVAPDADDRERFQVEGRAVARIQHPNVVTIYRVGQLEGHPYLITEYIRGKSLNEIQVPLPSRKVLELAIGLCRGLAAAHRHGVLHRDIKLANAILAETGEIKLLDFSLAKLMDPAALDPVRPEPAKEEAIEAASSAVLRSNDVGRIDRAAETIKLRDASASGALPRVHADSAGRSSAGLSAAALSAADIPVTAESLTQAGTLLGTPHYMAPELWRAEPASRRSDVYALGVLMYILASGRPPTEASTPLELAERLQEYEPRPLIEKAPRCDPRLAGLIDRCLRRDPFLRFGSADDLLAALESLQPSGRELVIPEGNPYRGLQAFESKHRAVFFGRGVEIRAVIERLRADALVVVAGDSGVGKSSLVKAGVVPMVEEGNLDHHRQWASAAMTPGRYPLQTLISTLAVLFDMSEETLAALIAESPGELVRALRKQLGEARGRLLVIDQFEELVTLSATQEVAIVGPLLARLAAGLPGLRVMATVRGDFLTRVVQVPGIGDELSRAIYILRPLSPEGAREAIVGPAKVKGVRFEPSTLVDELVEAAARGSLPLLQFALAELWEIRDQAANIISPADLRKVGGVSGALARHGDAVLAELIPAQRAAARRILMRLVTVDDTRAVRTEDELTADSPAAAEALKALVRARLVVAREVNDDAVFEIAHEALLGGWSTLSTWLEEERDGRATRHRLELAVAEWERLGRGRDALWSGAPLQEVMALDPASLRPKERDFIAACKAAAARVRAMRRGAIVLVPAVAISMYGAMWLKSQRDLRLKVDAQVTAAEQERAVSGKARADAEELRTQALAAYDAGKTAHADGLWTRYEAALPEAELRLARSAQKLETALSLDGRRDDIRERLGEVLLERALLAEQAGHGEFVIQDLLERLKLYDEDGGRIERWNAPALFTATSHPPGARVQLERYDPKRTRIDKTEELGTTPVAARPLDRGSYRLRFELAGYAPVTLPITLAREEVADFAVVLPPADTVPAGFVYVPAGRFLYGTGDIVDLRQSMNAEPLHRVETGAYVIGRHEVTWADYIEFLSALPAGERAAILAINAARVLSDSARLTELPQGGWQLELHQTVRVYTVRTGEPLVYEGRTQRARVEWERLPVTGIGAEEATAYFAWLNASGRVPGARFCNEHEWERAARGADDRRFSIGEHLEPSEANIDRTYGLLGPAFGPDPVGSYPQSVSPYGLYDTIGNAYELTVSPYDHKQLNARGGAFYYNEFAARVPNRFEIAASFRHSTVGLRVCATWPLTRS
ncbi:nSTAND1 domain-containing NTPase [Nannocystis punicea]|nr:protein kinase [Nannocystis poenicansa]